MSEVTKISQEDFAENLAEAILKRRAAEQAKQDAEDAELFKTCADGLKRRLEEAARAAKEAADKCYDEELLRMVNSKKEPVKPVMNNALTKQKSANAKRKKKRYICNIMQFGLFSAWFTNAILLLALVLRIMGLI